jgi:hypothetical protein
VFSAIKYYKNTAQQNAESIAQLNVDAMLSAIYQFTKIVAIL